MIFLFQYDYKEGDPKVKWVALFVFYRSSSYSG